MVLAGVVFVCGSLIPYIQMNQYHSILVNGGNFENILEKDAIFSPHTTATDMVCTQIIGNVSIPITKTFNEVTPEIKAYVPFLQNVLLRCSDTLTKSTDPVDRFLISTIYMYLGNITNEKVYFDKSDALIKSIFDQSPKRQPFVEFAGVNSFFKRDFVNAKKQFTEALKTNPNSRQATYYLNTINSFGIK